MPRPLLLAACALLAVTCGQDAPRRPPNLLLISIDTLRADRLGTYGNVDWSTSPSPRIDELARLGVTFEQAYAPRGETHPSIASLLTGKYPITTGVRENGYALTRGHETLLERLQSAGWRTGAFVANFEVTHRDDAWVARGADVAADGFGGQRRTESAREADFQRIWDDRVEQAALAFLAEPREGKPFALWVHFYDVHKPFNPPPELFDAYGDVAALPESLRALGPEFEAELERHLFEITLGERPVPEEELLRLLGLYDGGVTATDARVGRLLDALAAAGETDDTLVLLTSDHGEELFDRNRYFFHGCSIYEGVVRVPLIAAGRGVSGGRRIEAHVQNVDLVPMVLELFGLPPADDVEGTSLARLVRGESDAPPAPYAFIEWQDLVYAVTDGRHKLIYNPRHVHPRHSPYAYDGVPPGIGFRIDCIEGYDLDADPREQHNLLADFDLARLDNGRGLPAPWSELFRALSAWLADPRHQNPMLPQGLGDEQIARMRQLGYLGTGQRSDAVHNEPCVPP